MKELTVRAEAAMLDGVTDFVNAALEALDCPMKTQMQIDLAVEEIFINIASYAYGEEGGDAVIRIGEKTGPAAVEIVFEDGGKPFDPTAQAEPDRTSAAADRPIGGLGIFLTKKIMDEVSYEYRDGHNVLRLAKTL